MFCGRTAAETSALTAFRSITNVQPNADPDDFDADSLADSLPPYAGLDTLFWQPLLCHE